MLQQTQIRTVIPHYRKFIRAFPTVKALADAPLERVLEIWSGLGYYRRARNLHQAARMVVSRFAGNLPCNLDQLRVLPGIGDYTARAILSIAFGQPYAALDGNVARVMARLIAMRGNLGRRKFRTAVEFELARLLSRRRPGDFNQALMEIGQTICLPRAPRCSRCPLHHWCQGSQSGSPQWFLEPRPRRPAEDHYLAIAAVRHDSRVLMVRGLDGDLLHGLWNFPSAFGSTEREARVRLQQKLADLLGERTSLEHLADFEHTITYRWIHGSVHLANIDGNVRKVEGRWFKFKALEGAAISQLSRKVARLAPTSRQA